MKNQKIIVQLAEPEPYYLKCYHNFMDCTLLNGEEKIIFLSLKRFLDIESDCGNVSPTIEKIQKMTGWSRPRITRYIESLIKKGVVKKIRKGKMQPNTYILSDDSSIWTCDSGQESVTDSQDLKDRKAAEYIAQLEKMGCKVDVAGKVIKIELPKTQNQAPHELNPNFI